MTVVNAIIEIPMKTRNKFEIDKKTGRAKLDRVLYSSVSYPAEYGYIEQTLALDGDPLDILVLSSEPTVPGCIVPARIVGYLDTVDRGFEDQKVIAVVDVDPRFDYIKSIDDIPAHIKLEINEFFSTYKKLQNLVVETKGFHGIDETLKLIEVCKKRYEENN